MYFLWSFSLSSQPLSKQVFPFSLLFSCTYSAMVPTKQLQHELCECAYTKTGEATQYHNCAESEGEKKTTGNEGRGNLKPWQSVIIGSKEKCPS